MELNWRAAFVGLFVLGCGPDQITPLSNATAPVATTDAGNACASSRVCAPGSTELCFCADTSRGAQVCAGDGLSWEACACPGVKLDASSDR